MILKIEDGNSMIMFKKRDGKRQGERGGGGEVTSDQFINGRVCVFTLTDHSMSDMPTMNLGHAPYSPAVQYGCPILQCCG